MLTVPHPWLDWIQQRQIIAVIRSPDPALALKMAYAVVGAGIECIEITWATTQAPELIQQLQTELPHCCIGTGTILTEDELRQAIDVGAKFVFSPHTNGKIIDQAVAAQVAVIPGALTPTEIITAWQRGATAVKIFPVSSCGGYQYLQQLRPVLTDIPLIPTGGVTLQNAGDFLQAGAIAVGLAGDLFPKLLIETENWSVIRARAEKMVKHLQNTRG